MSINWQNLRTFSGSQNSAFEELCCQLASYESMPLGSTFKRKAPPDAGVECFWQCPDGSEHGWQVKYFFNLDRPQWNQLDESVERALEKHPYLKSYTICLPIDLRNPRTEGRTDQMMQWDAYVEKWKGWAHAKGMQVEFPYWGEHQIWERLTREEHRGRYFFWFHEEFFSHQWLLQNIDIAVANAGPRYTPEHNVNLPISKIFDGLGRTKAFFYQINIVRGKIKEEFYYLCLDKPHTVALQQFSKLDEACNQLLLYLENLPETGIDYIDFPAINKLCRDITDLAWEAHRLLDGVKTAQDAPTEDQKRVNRERINSQKHYLYQLTHKISDLTELTDSQAAELANIPALLLTGNAGSGKSHLFCDIAKQRIADGRPTVLLLGENFSAEEPWSQIIKLLGLNCRRDEFLGAMESAAQAAGAKALLMLDALNEGEGKQFWHRTIAGMLATLANYPRVALAVSVRSSYERTVIPDGLVPGKLIRVEHSGFTGHELEAATTFFNYYGISAPSMPLLSPEFNNPLFLKLFCKGLKNKELSDAPKGLHGITAIFNFFIESANDKLSKPQILDYDPAIQPVKRAIDALADLMAARSETWLMREDAKATVESILPSNSWDKSFFRHLLAEGVLAEDRKMTSRERDEWVEIVRFSYERLSDHLVTQRLLDQQLDLVNPAASFLPDQPLGILVKDQISCWRNRGIVEALCIQLPERIGKELVDCVPSSREWQPIKEAFVESLVWRSSSAFGETYRKYFGEVASSTYELFGKCTGVLLTVAANPDHPLNAEFLNRSLSKDSMAERDAWWSIFLHRDFTYDEGSPIRRLIDWAWSESDKSHISDESIRLAGISLAWFLTTSNRSLRDRATKALVALLTSRIPVLRKLLEQFQGVNDVYVLERLYAVAYGCAMRSNDEQAISTLALDVYAQIFKDGTPPAHVLLRDYARGVIEVALNLGLDLPIDVTNIRPPYQSEWPDDIPNKDEIETWEKRLSEGDKYHSQIYGSVMGWGDFSRYIIGTNSGHFEWTSRKLSEMGQPTRKEKYNEFINSLTANQQKAWERFLHFRDLFGQFLLMDAPRRLAVYKEEITEEMFRQYLAEVQEQLKQKLGKKKGKVLEDVIIPYLNEPHLYEENPFDLSLAQRFVLKRVVELGWEEQLFGEFEREVNQRANNYRDAHKPERIGKKYQWIAWHEFLARVADNFEYKSDKWSERKESYDGPWQDSHRDIDPSCLLKKTMREDWKDFTSTWWFPVTHNDWGREWKEQQIDEEWVRNPQIFPAISPLLEVVNPKDGSVWLSLNSHFQWDQPVPVGEDRYKGWYKRIWVILNSYIVKRADIEGVFEWALDQNFYNRWMPEPHDQYRVFWGEYFWSQAYNYFDITDYSNDGWSRGQDDRVPKPILVSTEGYSRDNASFDCSTEDSYHIKLPCKSIVEEMELRSLNGDGKFYDKNNNLIAFDPSVASAGPGALLVRKENFLQFLNDRGYDLLWTVLGEKMSFPGGGGKQIGRLVVNGAYRTQDGKVIGNCTPFFDEGWASE